MVRMIIQVDGDRAQAIARMMKSREHLYKRLSADHPDFRNAGPVP